tara:strand:+ start:21616 stop:22326 length:711 start_codon:yes stop_codon:yes gene_type:complete
MPKESNSIARFDHELSKAADRYRIKISAKGLDLPEDLTIEEWNRFGDFLAQANNSVGFWVGDWINFGEAKWGEKYAEAMELTGFEYDTLAIYAYVAKRVELLMRINTLTFNHHRMVAKLPPEQQARWLQAAEKYGLSSRLLSASITAGKVLQELPRSEPTPKNHITHINRLVTWWRSRAQDALQKADEDHKDAIRRDLRPVVEIYLELGGDLEGLGTGEGHLRGRGGKESIRASEG